MMPPNPGDWEKHDNVPTPLAWLHGDHEYYPVWSTTLYEQDQIWRTKFHLRTSEDRVERLAQEVALYILVHDIAHDEGGDDACH